MTAAHTSVAVVEATASEVFELLRDPSKHQQFDGSAMLGDPRDAETLTRVGQIFTMNMTYTDGHIVEHYLSDNHVVAFEPCRVIAWATAVHGGPPLGWTWRYDLIASDQVTEVRLTYDWSDTPPDHIRRFGVPLVRPDELAESLRLLAALVSTR